MQLSQNFSAPPKMHNAQKRLVTRYLFPFTLVVILLFLSNFRKISQHLPKSLSIDVNVKGNILNSLLASKSDDFSYHTPSQVASASDGECISMKEAKKYYPESSLPPPSPSFLKALRDQEDLQKKCTNNIVNWNDHYKVPEKGYEDCKYVIWMENGQGLGNRFLSLLSAFMYSLLTKRVLLIDVRDDIDRLICNPFPDSSVFLTPQFDTSSSAGMSQAQFMGSQEFEDVDQPVNNLHIQLRWYSMSDSNQFFFCDFLQERIKNVRWLLFDSEMYIIPGYYFISEFSAMLDSYFPNRLISSYLARYFLFPSNSVWREIRRIYKKDFSNAKKRIGVQIRSFSHFSENVAKRVISCVAENQVLPLKNNGSTSLLSTNHQQTEVSDYLVFITSLGNQHHDYFKEHLVDYFDITNNVIRIVKQDTNSVESHSVSQNYLAMIDIWLLSMSDTLFTSYISTFGYLAKSLNGNRAHMLNICELYHLPKQDTWTTNSKPLCHLSKSTEPCFLLAPVNMTCIDRWNFPFITECEDAVEGLFVTPSW